MRIAVLSTVIFDVPDDQPLAEIRDRFYEAHRVLLNVPMETLTGQAYVPRKIERLEVVQVPQRVES